MRPRRTSALVATVLAVCLVGGPALAQTDSGALERRLQTAQARLAEIETEVSEAVEDLNVATVALEEVEHDLAQTEDELARLRAEAAALGDATARHVRQLYRMGPAVELASVFSGGTATDVSERAVAMRRLLTGQIADLEGLAATRVSLAAAEARLQEHREQAGARQREADARRAEVEQLVAARQAEVERLSGQLAAARQREEEERRREQERLRAEAESRRRAQEEQAQARAARQQASRAAPTSTGPAPSGGGTSAGSAPADSAPSDGGSAPSARQSAQVAVDAAVSQVGKPYRYGAAGPDAYDCSGLTSWAWRQAGVTIPRTSSQQFSWTRSISRSQLQPGDLIFFGRGRVSHVAMYIGNGRVVEAPYTGKNVRISNTALSRSDILGYGRV